MRGLCLTFLILLQSCAGYKQVGASSLFKLHNIDSVVVNQTSNDSSYYNVSHYFSNALTKELLFFRDLHIKNSLEGVPGESVLVTRLVSDLEKEKNISVDAMKFIDKSTGYSSSIGDREGFYVNYQLTHELNLEVVLIKHPKVSGSDTRNSSEIVFKKYFPVVFKINNLANPGGGADGNGAINLVMNKSIEEKAFEISAASVAEQVRGYLEK